MQTNKENLLQTIPRLFALCATIREAAAHGADQPASADAMKEDVAAGIRAVEEAARQLCPNTPLAPAALDELAGAEGQQISGFVNAWFSDVIGPFLLQQFQKALRREWRLSQQDAQSLAHWVLRELPALPATKKDLLLEIGMHCADSAPEFSWQLMIQVADSLTEEEQKEKFPYWTGAPYRAGQHPQTELKRCPICGGAGKPYMAAFSGRMNDYDPLF